MRKAVVVATCLTGVLLSASQMQSHKVVQSGFDCPLKGCTLECSVDNSKSVAVSGIRNITMRAYRDIGTFYALDMGMEAKRTVIVDGEAVLCQIIDHK